MLEIKDVRKSFGPKVALDSVSLTVNDGTVYGLLGPNGAGKTTLIRIINGITAPDSGEALLNGEHIGIEQCRCASVFHLWKKCSPRHISSF